METKAFGFNDMQDHWNADRIRSVLRDIVGVRKIDIPPDKKEASVSYDEITASFEEFEEAITNGGYHLSN